MPPPTWRHAPVKAGRLVTARMAWPPPQLFSKATPILMADGCVVAYSLANLRISSAGMPVMASAHSGVLVSAFSANSA